MATRIAYILVAVGAAGQAVGPSPVEARTVWHVDTGAHKAGDGQSWERAFVNVQDALDVASSGDEVWVAKGCYIPRFPRPGDVQSSTFQLPSGIAVYGGFAGGETSREQRNWVLHPTILSGDLNYDDDLAEFATFTITGLTCHVWEPGILWALRDLPDYTLLSALQESEFEIRLSAPMELRTVPETFPCWTSSGFLGWYAPRAIMSSSGVTSLTMTFSEPVGYFGCEVLPLGLGTHTVTASFMNGDQIVGTLTQDVIGGCGTDSSARTFAATTETSQFTHVVISGIEGDAGLGIAQMVHTLPGLARDCNNARHVVTTDDVSTGTTLDGFTITAGRAGGYLPSVDGGGGLINVRGSPTIANCLFTGNQGFSGGAAFSREGSPTFIDCRFIGNEAPGRGGGVFSFLESSAFRRCEFTGNFGEGSGGLDATGDVTIVDCTFTENFTGYIAGTGGALALNSYQGRTPSVSNSRFLRNTASKHGGAIFVQNGEPTLTGCTFIGNSARFGGAVFDYNFAGPSFSDCRFVENTALGGAAVYAISGGSPEFTNCTFFGNHAVHGGCVYSPQANFVTFLDCRFIGNSASEVGGALGIGDGAVTNCLFSRNSGGVSGGAVYVFGHPVFANCSVVDNVSLSEFSRGGGGFGVVGSHAGFTLTDSIVWGNVASGGAALEVNQIRNDGAPITINSSTIQGLTGDLGGNGNVGDDPAFVPGPGGCYYLSQSAAGQALDSPAVDAGSDTAASLGFDSLTTRSDEAGDTGIVDMGFHYPVTGATLVMGDFDRSGRVDLRDFAALQTCFSGTGQAELTPCCRIFDYEPDLDIDLGDASEFRSAMTGP